jgi:galactokinase
MKQTVTESFQQRYGTGPDVVTRAPGRLEILGNHTDYNEGFVISGAVANATWFAASPAKDNVCRIYDVRDDCCSEFAIDDVDQKEDGDWANYIKGVIIEMRQRGAQIAPFNAVLSSTVPLAAGMSSSAALEISTAFALASIWDIDFTPEAFARIGQGCENNFIGAQTGLLDQFSSIHGRADHLLMTDFRSLEVTTVPFTNDYVFVIGDTGVTHDLTETYNERRANCESAAAHLAAKLEHVTTLRDVSLAELETARPGLDILAYRRAKHVVGENTRVQDARTLLQQGDIAAFGELLFASHNSSRENFDNSCPELDILVELGRSLPDCEGARLSGGGFGGITIHLVRRDAAETYQERLAMAFQTRTGEQLTTIICEIAGGAETYV